MASSHFSTDNPFIESFNGSLRDERLNTPWPRSLDDARAKIESLRDEHHHIRPHTSLANSTPVLLAEAIWTISQRPMALPIGHYKYGDKVSIRGAQKANHRTRSYEIKTPMMTLSTPYSRGAAAILVRRQKFSLDMRKKLRN